MGDRHRKAERAKHQPDFIFAQHELPIQIDRHEIKKHPFAKAPQQQGNRDK